MIYRMNSEKQYQISSKALNTFTYVFLIICFGSMFLSHRRMEDTYWEYALSKLPVYLGFLFMGFRRFIMTGEVFPSRAELLSQRGIAFYSVFTLIFSILLLFIYLG